MNKEDGNIEFYGGVLGPWIPVVVMIVGMIAGTMIGGGGLVRFSVIAFGSLVIGFFLAKDKKNFGRISIGGLTNHMLAIIIMAFLLAGVLSQLLRQSGLIGALIWVAAEWKLSAGLIPLLAFLICAVISTACGTSSGSVAAVAPVLLPVASQLGCDLGLVCGAIISGAIFGDNLAPISDTTIGSALTQEAEVRDVVRTRLPYSIIAGLISAALFVFIGLSSGDAAAMTVNADPSHVKSLALLVLPVLMIVMMKYGMDLVATLLVCDVIGIALNLALGCIDISVMFTNDGPIGKGMTGMLNIILYCFFIFQMLEMLNASGAFRRMIDGMLRVCRTPRSGELACMLSVAMGTAAAGGSSPAVIFLGPMVRSVTKRFGIEKTRGANILDATACGVSGILPYGTGCMLCLGFVADFAPPSFSFFNIIPYSFHSMMLLAVFFLSIVTGIGRRFENEGEPVETVAVTAEG